MAKAPGGLAFTPESSQPLGVVAHFGRQNFYGDAVPQQNMPRKINGPHAALAEQRFDLVLPIEDGAHQRFGILFQDFAARGAKAHTIIVFGIANGAVFHVDLIAKRYIQLEVSTRLTPLARSSVKSPVGNLIGNIEGS